MRGVKRRSNLVNIHGIASLRSQLQNIVYKIYVMKKNIIEIKNLTKYYGKTKGVEDLNLDVKEGEVFGFLGPNGAGKTTTIRCVMDFIRKDKGEIKIMGKDAQKDSVKLKKNIGYLSDEVYLYDNWSGKKHIRFISRLNGKHNVAEKLVKRLGLDLSKKTKNLSTGNRQKLGVVLAFMFEPKLLILDEPTKGLDPLLQNTLYELIDEAVDKGSTVFMSSHNLPEVDRVCDRVGIIKDGRMIATEDITELKSKRIYSVRIYFANNFNKDDFQSENVEIEKELRNGLLLKVKGDINKVIEMLSPHKLKDIDISPASLEDIFLEFYKKN